MRPHYPLQYFIWWRRPPGPWQARNLPGGMVDLGAATRAAQATLQEQPGVQTRVLDQHGKVHWESDPEAPEPPPPANLRAYFIEQFKRFHAGHGRNPAQAILSPRVYAGLVAELLPGTGEAVEPPGVCMGARLLLRNDATKAEVELS